jgi:hypothetical protein
MSIDRIELKAGDTWTHLYAHESKIQKKRPSLAIPLVGNVRKEGERQDLERKSAIESLLHV